MYFDVESANNIWNEIIQKVRFYRILRIELCLNFQLGIPELVEILHINYLPIFTFLSPGIPSPTRISWTASRSRSSSASNSQWTITASIFKIGWTTSASCTFNERFTAQQLLMDSHVHCVLIILTFCSFQYVIYLLWRNQYYMVIFIENKSQKRWCLVFQFYSALDSLVFYRVNKK